MERCGETMIAFKVCQERDGVMVSAIAERPGIRMEYPMGVWLEPPILDSPIFAFETLESARFFDWMPHVHIFECEAEPFEDFVSPRFWLPDLSDMSCHSLEQYWFEGQFYGSLRTAISVPPGTILCSRIKLLREVVEDEKS